MQVTHLRKVGGSVMLVVPPPLLDRLGLRPGTKVVIAIEGERLVVEPPKRPRYTLNELLERCNPKARRKYDREWLDSKPLGDELI